MARRRSRQAAQPAAATTPPPRGGAYRPLSDHGCDAIVEHALAILADVGLAGAPASARDRLVAGGAVERDDGRLTLPRPMVEAAVERSPSRVDLPGFVEDRGLSIGGGTVHIGTGGAAVQTLDAATGAYRPSTLADLWSMMRVVDASPNIHYGLRPLVGRDAPTARDLDLNTAFACVAATSKPTGVSFTTADNVDAVVDLFDLALGSTGAFARRPFCMAVAVHVVPPLRFSDDGCDIIEAAIERGMVVQTCSAGQAGATSPASLAGALAQGLAEILAAVVLIDAIKPGHPAIHAFMPFVSDLRTGAMTGGGGEAAVASAGAAQLLNALGLPNAVSAGITDAKVADTQSGYEKGYTVALAAQAGADMVQLSVGMLGSIMVASPEALVIDDEMCGAILRSVRGIDVTTDALDLAMVESVVTGDGHYLGHPQTLDLMRTEYVYPTIGDRASVADWETAGRPAIWDRARQRVSDILSAGRPGHLPAGAEESIRSAFDILVPPQP